MENIIANNEISFNSLEKDIFSFVRIMGQIMTKSIIEYRRHKYIRKNEEGINEIIYPLDEKLKINKIGLFSENMCDKVVEIASKNSFSETDEIIARTTNTAVSHQECWNVVQEVGKSIVNKENNIVTKMYENKLKPTREVKVLFEEEDGVWLKMQGAKHQKIGKQELKVGVTYDGIIKDGKIYQLDRFHINLNITRDITFDKTVAKEIKRLLRQCEIET